MTTELVTASAAAIIDATYAPDRNPALVYLAGLSESSRRTMGDALSVIASILHPGAKYGAFPWAALRYQHTTAIRTQLAERYSASSANLHLSALRGVLKECWRLGYMSAEEYQRAIDLKTVKGQKAKQAEKGRHLKQGELNALLGVCQDNTPTGARDAAIVAVGYTCGLRRAELAALRLEDYDPSEGQLTIIRGKGNKERIVPLASTAKDTLDDWIITRGPWAGTLFTRILKGGHITLDALTTQAIYFILTERAKQAGVKAFSPHDLRRTFAGDLLDAGADISTVQKLMGHENVTTTAGYDRRDARAKRDAVNKLHIAYQKKAKN